VLVCGVCVWGGGGGKEGGEDETQADTTQMGTWKKGSASRVCGNLAKGWTWPMCGTAQHRRSRHEFLYTVR
jgi:hypothetical protein